MSNKYFTHRGSVRNFKNKEIPESLIDSIIEQASHAPTCGNMQLYSVVVTRDKEKKKKIEEYHFNQPASTTANVILTVCADFNLFTKWCEISEANPGYDNFHSFIMALTDAVIFAQQIVTIAEMEGLGTCYLGTVNYNAKEISEILKLPERVVPVAAIALGYPEKNPMQTDRLPLKAILHKETYRNDSEEEIREFFFEKENLEENVNFVKENNKNFLAQVFTDIRYPREMNEKVSASFLNLIKEKGFTL